MSQTTVIYHSADYDGIFCREIARKFLPDAKLVGWNFGDPPLQIPNTRLYVLDLPLDAPFGFDYRKAGNAHGPQHPAGLVWIDHHKSSIDSHPKDIPGVRIDGVAACRLAWQWFFHEAGQGDTSEGKPWSKEDYVERRVTEPIAVRLVGEYDIWDKRDPDAETFQFGLRSRELTDDDWHQLLSILRPKVEDIERLMDAGHAKDLLEPNGTARPPIVWQLLEHGRVIQRYAQQADASICKTRTWLMEWEGIKFLCVNSARFNSLFFAARDIPETGHDALLGFCFDGKQWTVSLYHAKHCTELDLSRIAVKYGGGGHRGACGFTCDKLPFMNL